MRIALVDPSSATRSAVAQLLEARGHDVLPFADESKALGRIQADPLVEALITGDELSSVSGLELCWETRLLATCRRPIYVLYMSSICPLYVLGGRPSQPDRGARFRRRRFHLQAAARRGALCAAARR